MSTRLPDRASRPNAKPAEETCHETSPGGARAALEGTRGTREEGPRSSDKQGTTTPETCTCCGSVLSYPFEPGAMSWIEAKAPTRFHGGKIPPVIIALPDARLATQAVYEATGITLARWGLPRRQYFLELGSRIDWYCKAGGRYVGVDLRPLPISVECFEPFLDRDPSCKVIGEWIRRAAGGEIKQAPKASMIDLIRLVNLALRTPPCGFAI